VTAAVGWQLLQWFGSAYVSRVAQTNDTYGIFGLVLGLIGFIYVAATVVVLSVELNVVLARRLYPRAMLAPFTDQARLTDADEQTLGDVTRATKVKDYEEVEVTFDQEDERPEG
jgi:uncharacterized BrkB/YihY/UPF0761 family membrane protein